MLPARKQPDMAGTAAAPQAGDRPTAIIIGAQPAELEILERQIGDVLDILETEAEPLAGLRCAREHETSFVLLYLDHSPDTIMAAASELAQAHRRHVIMVSRDRDPDHIVNAMRAGVRDFAYLEQDDEIRRAVQSWRADPAAEAAPQGQVVAVYGAKGGSGATTVATNLAGALLGRGQQAGRTVLVDLDLRMGDAMVFLDLAGGFGWGDLLRNMPRLDDELLERSLLRHDSGIRVVAETGPIEAAEPADAAAVSTALRHLRSHAAHVVVDGLSELDEATLAALDVASTILLTFTQDVPALKNASRCLQVFRRLGYDRDKVKLVVNRYHKRSKLGLDAMADALGTEVDITVGNDFPAVVGAINNGKLLADAAPRARVTRDFRRLAELLDPQAPAPRRGLFLGGKR